MATTIIIARSSSGKPDRASLEQELAELCVARGLDVLLVPDLYHIAENSEIWEKLARLRGRTLVFSWMYPRPAEWVLRRHRIGDNGLQTFDLASYEAAQEALAAPHLSLAASDGSQTPGGALKKLQEPISPRWHPVVDRSRCTDCQHCLQFCIFGVYQLDDAGRVMATNPDNCKPGCPACARVCPNSAIMFPLFTDDDAICGAPGKLVTLDAPARRMYYVRTGKRCPECGQEGEATPTGSEGGNVCPECGRQLPGRLEAPDEPRESNALDEIDALIDELDDIAGGSQ